MVLLTSSSDSCRFTKVIINKNYFCAIRADDLNERAQGLSGVKDLGNNEAMLFIFDEQQKHGIWMKDMLIPLDILWLSADKRVVHIEEYVTPESYPRIYYPRVPAKYVLELKSGIVDKLSICQDYQFQW